MSLFRRRSERVFRLPPPPKPSPRRALDPVYAVPVDQSEALVLVTALRAHDRIQRELDWTPGAGPSHSAGMADRILKTAGTAACYGQQAIPLEVADLDSLRYTLAYLQEQQPSQPYTLALAQLLNRLTTRSGMAKLKQWRVTWSDEAGTLWWEGPPPQPAPVEGASG
jgi:hypothetical protein